MPNKFWKFQNWTGGDAELLLYGDIASEQSWWGDEVTPKQFAGDLAGLGAVTSITVRINSGGGDVFAAQTIGNLLEQHNATVTARIDGVCASAATIIACHCDKVIAANDSTYMVHPVRMYCGYANEADLKKYLEALAAIKENIIGLYAKKTGREKEEVTAWMDAESWWTGPQAKEHGFVDELHDDGDGATYENRGGVLFVNGVGMNLPFGAAPKFVQDSSAEKSAGQLVNNRPAGEPGKQEGLDMELKTVDDLRDAYPALVDQIEQAAIQNGVEAERKRIQDIEDMALPGSEAVAADAKFKTPMSAEDFAKALVKNAKTQGAAYLEAAKRDAEKSGVNGVTNAPADGQDGGDAFLAAIKGAAPKR